MARCDVESGSLAEKTVDLIDSEKRGAAADAGMPQRPAAQIVEVDLKDTAGFDCVVETTLEHSAGY